MKVMIAAAGMAAGGGARADAVMLARTDDDVLLWHEMGDVAVVSRAVLKRHDQSVGADESLIGFYGGIGGGGFDEYHQKIGRFGAGAGKGGLHGVVMVRAVHFRDGDALGVDGLHLRRVGVDKKNIVLFRKVAAVQASHGSGAENRNFHIKNLHKEQADMLPQPA